MNMLQRLSAYLLVILWASVLVVSSSAQEGGDIIMGDPIAGVGVDATGVLKIRSFDPRVARQRLAATRQVQSDLMQTSELRKVSLNRLEKVIADQLNNGMPLSDEMLGVAGLTSVQYVFFYPESRDIVLAGPAEGFVADPTDRFIGIETGKPTVLLEDLVTVLRAYAPDAPPTRVISVSIDPTPEGLQRMQDFLRSVQGRVQPSDANRLASGLKQNLGLQTVSIKGVPNSTHFARVLVEADYRMKLIGIGLEEPPVRLKSYVDRANPRSVAANAMERWYFQPSYDGIAVSEDGLAMKINERGVQLVGANERVNREGGRVKGRVNKASQAFCREFTEQFPLIAQRVRVYAELRQLIDLAIAAAYIQERDFYGQAGWHMPVLGDESKVAVETHVAPLQVETAVNAIWRGNTLMTPLGGGIHMQPRLALRKDTLTIDTEGINNQAKKSAGPTDLAEGQWWWD